METIAIAVLIVVLGSALFAGMEAALFSVPISRARILAEKKVSGAAALVAVRERIQRPITVIVIANDVFMIVGSVVVGALAGSLFDSVAVGIVSVVMTLLIVIFGEIIPKAYGESHAEGISLRTAPVLLMVTRALAPVLSFFELLTKPFIKRRKIVSEEEIRILSRIGELEGSIEKDERELIQRVFLLNDLTAKDIMTPRTVMEAVAADLPLTELPQTIKVSTHTRLPVFENDLDHIVGVCHQRDLLHALIQPENRDTLVRDHMRQPMFVSSKMRCDALLPYFQRMRQHLAIVVDEFGGTSGVVTLEDVLEQLVGEIVDENDRVQDMRERATSLKERKQADRRGVRADDILN